MWDGHDVMWTYDGNEDGLVIWLVGGDTDDVEAFLDAIETQED